MPAQRPPPGTSTLKPIPDRPVDWPGLVGGAILAVATIAAYCRTFSVPLLFDDIGTIADNQSIRRWSTALSPPIDTTAGGRPILNLSLALNYAIGGTSVWSYHIVNLAIHVLAGLTLFGIVRRTLAPRAGPAAGFIAFFAALFWSLHPLQTESVTYIVQRAESLMGLFYLLTLYCFVRHVEAPVAEVAAELRAAAAFNPWAALSVLFCLLGMATKEVMVSAPLIVLLYDRTFLAGSFGEAWHRRWRVYAGLGATWLILPFLVLSTHGRGGTAGFASGVSWWSYALTQFPAILRYLKLSVWPHPLIFDYGTQWVKDFWAVLPSAAVVVGLIAATVLALFRPGFGWRSLGFAGAWFFAILAPTSLVPGNRQTAAEHRVYLALLPVAVLAVVGLYRRLGRVALAFSVALAAAFFAITFVRNEEYRSALILCADMVANLPENAYAHNDLGSELENLPGRLNDAIAQYEKALRLKPDFAEAHYNLGNAWSDTPGRLHDAIVQYQEALRLAPNVAAIHNNLGNAWSNMPGRLNEAIDQYEKALRLKPDNAEAHSNLGNALSKMPGRLKEAIAQHQEALRQEPGYAEAHNNLGNALNAAGRPAEAIAQYQEALRLKPDYPEAHNNLGNALGAAGRPAEAVDQYQEALRLKPDYAEAHDNLGNTLSIEGRPLEAIAQFQEVLRLNPDDAETHNNLGNALSVAGRPAEAIAQYREALRLKPDYAEAHNNLGNALSGEGRPLEAIGQYQEALRLNPDDAGTHNNLASALCAAGRPLEAIGQYEEALHLMPADAAIHFHLAVALLDTPGRINEAVAQLEATLRLQPGNDSARQMLARIRASQP